MDEDENVWKNKKAKIEILKDGKRLIYTATILEIDSFNITFIDRDEETFSFSRADVKQMQLLGGGDNNGY